MQNSCWFSFLIYSSFCNLSEVRVTIQFVHVALAQRIAEELCKVVVGKAAILIWTYCLKEDFAFSERIPFKDWMLVVTNCLCGSPLLSLCYEYLVSMIYALQWMREVLEGSIICVMPGQLPTIKPLIDLWHWHSFHFSLFEDWDLGTCLKNECYRKQLRMPHPLRSWIDLRATYKVSTVLVKKAGSTSVYKHFYENHSAWLHKQELETVDLGDLYTLCNTGVG